VSHKTPGVTSENHENLNQVPLPRLDHVTSRIQIKRAVPFLFIKNKENGKEYIQGVSEKVGALLGVNSPVQK
jgi:hypothetical protein